MNQEPPETVFYAPGVAGKTGPFYIALRGIRSARRTSAKARYGKWAQEHGHNPNRYNTRVWIGKVTWTEINMYTGEPIEEELS